VMNATAFGSSLLISSFRQSSLPAPKISFEGKCIVKAFIVSVIEEQHFLR
jgi:hypothetical protein